MIQGVAQAAVAVLGLDATHALPIHDDEVPIPIAADQVGLAGETLDGQREHTIIASQEQQKTCIRSTKGETHAAVEHRELGAMDLEPHAKESIVYHCCLLKLG